MSNHVPDYPPRPSAKPEPEAVPPASPGRRNRFALAMTLAQRPGFCCCCWCVGSRDAQRARRIVKLVRRAKRRGHI